MSNNGIFTLPDKNSDPNPGTDICPEDGSNNNRGSRSLSESMSMSGNGNSFCSVQCSHWGLESESETVSKSVSGNVNKPWCQDITVTVSVKLHCVNADDHSGEQNRSSHAAHLDARHHWHYVKLWRLLWRWCYVTCEQSLNILRTGDVTEGMSV